MLNLAFIVLNGFDNYYFIKEININESLKSLQALKYKKVKVNFTRIFRRQYVGVLL